jgi:hypothetical protein
MHFIYHNNFFPSNQGSTWCGQTDANEADKQIIMGDGNHEHRTHDNVHMQPLKNIGIQSKFLHYFSNYKLL